MKLYPAFLLAFTSLAHAAPISIHCAGVLGNSGEQGQSLVRFGDKPSVGMGVVYDSTGSLWDRGGDGTLNRYAADGRLLSTHPIPAGNGGNDKDTLVILGDLLLIKAGAKLLTLPLNAASGTTPAPLKVEVSRLSFNTHQGWAAAANGKKVFMVNASGETKPVAELPDNVDDVEIGEGGGVFAVSKDKLTRVDEAAPKDARGPWISPGERPQWIAGRWFGSAWHGTIRRFSPALVPDPGVVLGGASGSFIGYVEGNHEMNNERGLASLGGALFAASGASSVLHLLEWHGADQRFTIVRRIGALPTCSGLGLDAKGRVWYQGGVWNWTDGPDAPFHHSVPPPDAPGVFGATMLANGTLVAPAVRWNQKVLYYGPFDGPAKLDDAPTLPKDAVVSTLVIQAKRSTLLVLNAAGKGTAVFVENNGRNAGDGGAVELQTSTPLSSLTSAAAMAGPETMVAAADGQVIEFQRQTGVWKETVRWNHWGDAADAHFGKVIYLTMQDGKLWVADTSRHRLLGFDPTTHQVLATFGVTDQAGNDLGHLQSPQTLAANGNRVILHDAGNQRLMKLEWQ